MILLIACFILSSWCLFYHPFLYNYFIHLFICQISLSFKVLVYSNKPKSSLFPCEYKLNFVMCGFRVYYFMKLNVASLPLFCSLQVLIVCVCVSVCAITSYLSLPLVIIISHFTQSFIKFPFKFIILCTYCTSLFPFCTSKSSFLVFIF